MAMAAMKGRLAHKYYEAAEEAYALEPDEEPANKWTYFSLLHLFCSSEWLFCFPQRSLTLLFIWSLLVLDLLVDIYLCVRYSVGF